VPEAAGHEEADCGTILRRCQAESAGAAVLQNRRPFQKHMTPAPAASLYDHLMNAGAVSNRVIQQRSGSEISMTEAIPAERLEQ
jgi:hypothetical protein